MTILKTLCGVAAALVLPVLGQEIPKVLAIGSDLPAFSLPGIDGKTYSQENFKDAKALCVIFTCNHCPDSVAAAGRTEQIYQDYKGKGVALVAVNGNNPGSLTPDELGYSPYNDSFAEMTPFAKDYGWTFPYLYDGEKQEFVTACGGQSTPHVFLFDSARKLRYTGRMDDAGRNSGKVDKSYLRDALDAVLADTEVKEKTTRSFGCSTKWLFKKSNVAADQESWEKREVTVADLDEATSKKLRENGSKNLRIINFWSTTCGPCVKEFPDLVETGRRFQGRPVEFISISVDPVAARPAVSKFLTSRHAASPDPTAKSMAESGLPSNNYHWTGGNPDSMATAIDSEWSGALPHTVLVAPGGKIVWRHTGELDITELRKQILKGIE
ncbi:redoxin family protein [Luteolibacter yonseiensis]|uniref:Redoxin family protein n=1 Tax=Luteolibacter yonseiensis TaxID=1144680 RepID=A0A934R495_9BACT|nr:redoxin family protein [Luteolibacter yonseiensis]MBK1816629.1 redoxin family protein [Luteolibacter yonseiensis]